MSLSAPGLARRKLPIGVQTFRKLREEGCYYVDKTPWIGRLVDEGDQYFLSRPRRFGKSLLLDTIEELFRGLAIHDRWDWTPSPVVRLSFGSGDFRAPDWLREDMAAHFEAIEKRAGLAASDGLRVLLRVGWTAERSGIPETYCSTTSC